MHTIEYIGPRPKKPAKKSWAGGWLMVILVVTTVGFVSKPFITRALEENVKVTHLKVEETVAWLSEGDGFGDQLAIAALERTQKDVVYDTAYYQIDYPNGDVPEGKGLSTDVVIRSYRALGVDFQELVHEDMQGNFRIYPQLWNATKPDTNIDHRRVPNLQRFLTRQNSSLKLTSDTSAENFAWGDVVAWRLHDNKSHIGIVVPGPGDLKNEKWVVHNRGVGPKWEDSLLDYQIIGHYRYNGVKSE